MMCIIVIEIIVNKIYIEYKECSNTKFNITTGSRVNRQNSGKVGSLTCFCSQNSTPTPWCSQNKITLCLKIY